MNHRATSSGYLALLRQAPGLIGFGFLACFASSFGQTFFIALFGADLRRTFDLSNAGFGAAYSAATLMSAAVLIWAGRLADWVPPGRLAALNFGLLSLACLTLAAAPSLPVLILALFLLRLAGQGMALHIAITTLAKRFETARGKAISAALLGLPLGETVLPPLAVMLLAGLGWRGSWTVMAALLALVLVPLLYRLGTEAQLAPSAAGGVAARDKNPPGQSLGEAARGVRFYLLVPGAVVTGFVITAVFFHQAHIVAERGWSPLWFAGLFSLYALASIAASLIGGTLVDRLGARAAAPFGPAVLVMACLVLALWPSPTGAALAMALFGTAQGAQSPAFNALWVEVYGVAHLGAIRAATSSLTVFGTALSPLLLGLAFDRTLSVSEGALALAGTGILALTLLVPGLAMTPARYQPAAAAVAPSSRPRSLG